MQESDLNDLIAGARAYEGLHVPALFRQWCPRVLDAAAVGPGDRLLDVACGTGILAREAALRTGPDGFVAGVDPGPGMLSVARELAPDIEWTPGTAESLPYSDNAFDVVVSQFGMMFFADRTQALHEMGRVLKPGGNIAVAVWDTLENSDAYPDEVALLKRLAGDEAANALRAPFVLGNTDELLDLFETAGFQSVGVETYIGTARFPDVRVMVEADLRGWLPVMGVFLEEALIQQILDEAVDVLADYVSDEGRVVFNAPAHIVTAVA